MMIEVAKKIVFKSTSLKHPISGLFGYKLQNTLLRSSLNRETTNADPNNDKLAFNFLFISLLKNSEITKTSDYKKHIERISNEFSKKYNVEQDKLDTLSKELELQIQDIDDHLWMSFSKFNANHLFRVDDISDSNNNHNEGQQPPLLLSIINKNSKKSISKYKKIQNWLESNNLHKNIVIPKSIFTQYKLFTEHTMHTQTTAPTPVPSSNKNI